MSYIIKTTSGLLNTRITDVGRKAISRGNFNISYFQVGDSEIDYSVDDPSKNNILMPFFNAHNDTGINGSNKHNVKYPYYLGGVSGTTYGIPFNDAIAQEFYNFATSKGFFISGETEWKYQTKSGYTITPNYSVSFSDIYRTNSIVIEYDFCLESNKKPSEGDLLHIIFDEEATCSSIKGYYPNLTYKIRNTTPTTNSNGFLLELDRSLPFYAKLGSTSSKARCLIYPSGMTQLYDSYTPEPNWENDVFNFETICDTSAQVDTLVWNMNIPWSETIAGVDATYEGFEKYGSYYYLGTKEYLGYTSKSGQTISNSDGNVYYYDSLLKKQVVEPTDQKAVAIVHYTNQSIDNVYGEKFITKPFDPDDEVNKNTARDFKVSLPTLMWHKSSTTKIGQTFYIDPPSQVGLCVPYYMKSTKNQDINDFGIRFYNLWDNNKNADGKLNRVGRVFPDSHLIVFDDEEIVAALSYKANRNWTLPAPSATLIQPNLCDTDTSNDIGVLSGASETLWITYRFNSKINFTDSLHCNYYVKVVGPDPDCISIPQNVIIKFGSEFRFLTQGTTMGFSANEFNILCQKVKTGERPKPDKWKSIDFTSQLNVGTSGYITSSMMTSNSFIISQSTYDAAPIYDLSDFITIPLSTDSDDLNFGDEYFFYGNIETGIVATIYEMRYLVNLTDTQFKTTSNPTYIAGKDKYVSEIGLYNSNKELMVISKLLKPIKRQGVQQYNVSLDF
jgi:hypothetical protein